MLGDTRTRAAGTVAILRDVSTRFEEARKLRRDLADALGAK
jgi:hypothetical protein